MRSEILTQQTRSEFICASVSAMGAAFLGQLTSAQTESPAGLAEARRALRDKQASAAMARGGNTLPSGLPGSVLEETLKSLRTTFSTAQGDERFVRRGGFLYDRKSEEERLRRAEAVVRRVSPAAFEDPKYFAYLAYQAASIEMAFFLLYGDGSGPAPQRTDPFPRFLLGTVVAADVNASQQFDARDYTIILLNSGFIDFLYQTAKAVAEAMSPVVRNERVVAKIDREAIRARLKANDAPVIRLYRTLESYFFEGYPRALFNETVTAEHSRVIGVLFPMAYRWAVAHEYGHGLSLGVDFSTSKCAAWTSEFFADIQATILTVLSAFALDRIGPELALAGATFTLACLDILERARAVVTTGNEIVGPKFPECDSHPLPEERAKLNIDVFRQYFDVELGAQGVCCSRLRFVKRKEAPPKHPFGAEHEVGVFAYSTALSEIWLPVKERLQGQHWVKRPLHKMWR